MRISYILLALAVSLAACGADDPASVDLTAEWQGSYTHPTFPGTLTLNLVSTDATLSGTFSLRYAIPGGGSQGDSGTLTGTRPSPNSVAFTLDAGTFTWSFVGQLTNANLMQGTWESTSSAGLNGLFEVERL
ncbi:MAG: hypothetical protein OEY20_11015 [Gemmatimonadota bacterium]|nr:hypothetical protein [Gemmatimonadota bacterium]MDH4350238.1 hypothetical protein [Gemmatimonadota bacterium]MDH5197773.1 hypothetical protein [Gemmatimonadota bacterium]